MNSVPSSEDTKRHYALLDVLLLLFWLLLTGQLIVILKGQEISIYVLLAGLGAASAVTLTAHEFVIRGKRREKESLFEYIQSLKNLIFLFLDVIIKLIVANGILMYQSLSLDIEPRVVKTKVNLKSDSEVTLISLLITLTPGTLVIDVEEEKDEYYLYVHFSYLKAEYLSEDIKDTITAWDERIRGVFK
ncbi:MAG: Na+/H+ antiporter subunit E [Candidatus Saliniplasma sp.]